MTRNAEAVLAGSFKADPNARVCWYRNRQGKAIAFAATGFRMQFIYFEVSFAMRIGDDYSHTHGDHWGGVRGLDLKNEDVASGKVKLIPPADFMDYTVAENVFAGNATTSRSP